MEAVGEFDKKCPNVILHGVEHLPIVGHLFGFLPMPLLFAFRHHSHEKSHVIAETLANIIVGIVGVFHHIMKECGDNRSGVEPQFFCSDCGDRYGMKYIWFARTAKLMRVRFVSQLESFMKLRHLAGSASRSHHFKHMVGFFLYYTGIFRHLSAASIIVHNQFYFRNNFRQR